jgi:hypothetical protein
MWLSVSSEDVFFNMVRNYLPPRKRAFLDEPINVSTTRTALSRKGSQHLRLVQACYRLYMCPQMKMKLFHGNMECKLLFILGIKLNFVAKVSQNAKLLNHKVGNTYGYHYFLNG